jgi:hypothetical protein
MSTAAPTSTALSNLPVPDQVPSSNQNPSTIYSSTRKFRRQADKRYKALLQRRILAHLQEVEERQKQLRKPAAVCACTSSTATQAPLPASHFAAASSSARKTISLTTKGKPEAPPTVFASLFLTATTRARRNRTTNLLKDFPLIKGRRVTVNKQGNNKYRGRKQTR